MNEGDTLGDKMEDVCRVQMQNTHSLFLCVKLVGKWINLWSYIRGVNQHEEQNGSEKVMTI